MVATSTANLIQKKRLSKFIFFEQPLIIILPVGVAVETLLITSLQQSRLYIKYYFVSLNRLGAI